MLGLSWLAGAILLARERTVAPANREFLPPNILSHNDADELCTHVNRPLVVYMYTRLDDFKIREERRRDFAQYQGLRDRAALLFPLGRCEGNCSFEHELEMEFRDHHDILRGDFLDTYGNLSLKFMSALRFLRRRCEGKNHRQQWFMKMDTDHAWNLGAVQEWTNMHPHSASGEVVGALAKHVPVLHGLHKNSEPELYHIKYYPTFAWGGCALHDTVAGDVMLSEREKFPYFTRNEDILTGLMTQNSSVTINGDARVPSYWHSRCKVMDKILPSVALRAPIKDCDCTNWFCIYVGSDKKRQAMNDFAQTCYEEGAIRYNVRPTFEQEM